MLQYENQRADRFMTWNLATERFSIVRSVVRCPIVFVYGCVCVYMRYCITGTTRAPHHV